jgi:hypothetical protein
MVTANPHGDWEAYCERTQQEADETLARSGHLEHTGDGPIAEGWQLTVGHGHSGFGIYAHMEEYPEEGAIFWRSLNDVQTDAYAEGRKDEADETKDAASELRKAMGISQDFSDWPLSTISRLCLQIGDKGQAFVVSLAANPEGGAWTIFNSGGAVVRDDCTLEEVRDYMTPERFERGWNAVYCINVTSQAQLDKLDMEKQ